MCQILSINNTENVWKPVVRICMLILGFPGLTVPFSFVEACSFTFVPSRLAEESNFYFRESYLGRCKATFSGTFKL